MTHTRVLTRSAYRSDPPPTTDSELKRRSGGRPDQPAGPHHRPGWLSGGPFLSRPPGGPCHASAVPPCTDLVPLRRARPIGGRRGRRSPHADAIAVGPGSDGRPMGAWLIIAWWKSAEVV